MEMSKTIGPNFKVKEAKFKEDMLGMFFYTVAVETNTIVEANPIVLLKSFK